MKSMETLDNQGVKVTSKRIPVQIEIRTFENFLLSFLQLYLSVVNKFTVEQRK